jgi:hypothetical protein
MHSEINESPSDTHIRIVPAGRWNRYRIHITQVQWFGPSWRIVDSLVTPIMTGAAVDEHLYRFYHRPTLQVAA